MSQLAAVDPYTLKCAFNAYYAENYLDLDHPAAIAGLVDNMTPEISLLKRDSLRSLSEDAQWAISIITQSTDSVWYQFTNDTGRFLKEKFNRWLHDQHHWSWNRIWRVMAEIRSYVDQME